MDIILYDSDNYPYSVNKYKLLLDSQFFRSLENYNMRQAKIENKFPKSIEGTIMDKIQPKYFKAYVDYINNGYFNIDDLNLNNLLDVASYLGSPEFAFMSEWKFKVEKNIQFELEAGRYISDIINLDKLKSISNNTQFDLYQNILLGDMAKSAYKLGEKANIDVIKEVREEIFNNLVREHRVNGENISLEDLIKGIKEFYL